MKKVVFLLLAMFTVVAQAQTTPVMSTGLSWSAPTQYTDNTPIPSGGLSNYTILCGASSTNLNQTVTVPATTTSYSRAQMLQNFAMNYGTVYFCALTVTATNGLTSARSATVSFTIQDTRIPKPPVLSVQ
jgi:hypothetical protein